MMRLFLFLAAVLLVAGCSSGSTDSDDQRVLIQISNAGAEPLRCRLMFGHWVDRDLGLARNGDGASEDIFVLVRQQPEDGALYIMRDDGQRRMMVENIFCARPNDWQATVGQIDLASVRTATPASVHVNCALPENGGRVICGKPEFTFRGSSTAVE
jgi:hypothetical protein